MWCRRLTYEAGHPLAGSQPCPAFQPGGAAYLPLPTLSPAEGPTLSMVSTALRARTERRQREAAQAQAMRLSLMLAMGAR